MTAVGAKAEEHLEGHAIPFSQSKLRRGLSGMAYLLFLVGLSATGHLNSVSASVSEASRNALTEAEKATPSPTGEKHCQPAVPFHFQLSPTAFSLRGEAREPRPDLRVWIWDNASTGDVVIVQLTKRATTSPSDFREFMAAVESAANPKSTARQRRIQTETEPYEGLLGHTLPTGVRVEQRCLSQGASHSPAWVVCVATGTADAEDLQAVRTSLAFGPC